MNLCNEASLPSLDYQAWCLFREENLDKLEGVGGAIDKFLRNHQHRLTGRVVDVSHDSSDSIRYMRDLGIRNRNRIIPIGSDENEALDLASSRAYLRAGVLIHPKESEI